MTERVRVIVNPAAGRGRGEALLPRIKSEFSAVGISDIVTTTIAGDEAKLAVAAIREGCTTLVVAGGDGTTSRVANAILATDRRVRLCVLPVGTGNDFAKVVSSRAGNTAAVARGCLESPSTTVDVGQVERTYFLNSCGFGFDVAVLQAAAKMRWLRGNALYMTAALRELVGFGDSRIGITSAAGAREPVSHLLLVIANAPYFGGTFTIAPAASVTDGKLDLISVFDVPIRRRIAVLAAATRGTHLRFPECSAQQGAEFSLAFDRPPAYEIDGELRQSATGVVSVRCIASALRVVIPE